MRLDTIHPFLNITHCFNLVEEPSLDISAVNLEADWQHRFLAMCQTCCDWDAEKTALSTQRLQWHIGDASIFPHKQALIHNLKAIYAALSNQLAHQGVPVFSDSERTKQLSPLAGDIESCTEGFYNRSIAIVGQLTQPKTLEGLLMRVRMSMVDHVARTITSDVHVHTQVFTTAHALGYGVPLINQYDQQAILQDITFNDRIRTDLGKYFNDYFRPFSIIHESINQIKIILSLYGYAGESIYTNGLYDAFLGWLNQITNNQVNYNYLIVNDQNLVIDLDWLSIKQLLVVNMIEQGFFAPSAEQIKTCFQTDILMGQASIKANFPLVPDLVQFLQCFPELPSETRNAIIDAFCNEFIDKSLLIYYMAGPICFARDPALEILFDYLKQHYLAELKLYFLTHGNSTPNLIRYPKMIYGLIGLFNYLPAEEHPLLIHSCVSLLRHLLRTGNRRAPLVLEEISKLPANLQIAIFAQPTPLGSNLLMLAFEKYPTNIRAIEIMVKMLAHIQISLGIDSIYPVIAQQHIQTRRSVMTLAAYNMVPWQPEEVRSANTTLESAPVPNPALTALVTMLESFSSSQNVDVFKSEYEQQNLPMLMMQEPALFLRILKLMETFDRKDILSILKHRDEDNYNLIMTALSDMPSLLPYLLALLRPQEESKATYEILSHRIYPNDYGWNLMMVLLLAQPHLAGVFMSIIKKLDVTDKIALLSQTCIEKGDNLLMQCADSWENGNDLLGYCYSILDTLPIQTMASLIKQPNRVGESIATKALNKSLLCVKKCRQYILDHIMDSIITALNFHTSSIPEWELVKHELLTMVNHHNPQLQKSRFKAFAKQIIDASEPSRHHAGFFSRSETSVRELFTALDYFGDALTASLTGGYANSAMLVEEWRLENQDSEPVGKRRRIGNS